MPMSLWRSYRASSTEALYRVVSLYGFGTACPVLAHAASCPVQTGAAYRLLSSYARGTACPVLTQRTVLPGSRGSSSRARSAR
eukprot:3941618-Rhodomonas_salina.2